MAKLVPIHHVMHDGAGVVDHRANGPRSSNACGVSWHGGTRPGRNPAAGVRTPGDAPQTNRHGARTVVVRSPGSADRGSPRSARAHGVGHRGGWLRSVQIRCWPRLGIHIRRGKKGGPTANTARVTLGAICPLAGWTVAEVRRFLAIVLPLPSHRAAFRLAWICWRLRKREQARQSHYRRSGHVAPPRGTAPKPP